MLRFGQSRNHPIRTLMTFAPEAVVKVTSVGHTGECGGTARAHCTAAIKIALQESAGFTTAGARP
jgi:hypothetical protein